MKRLINSCDSGPCTATLPTASNKSNSSIESTGVHRFTLAGSECFQFRSVPHRRQSLNWKFIGAPRQTAPPPFLLLPLSSSWVSYSLVLVSHETNTVRMPCRKLLFDFEKVFFHCQLLSGSERLLLRFLWVRS